MCASCLLFHHLPMFVVFMSPLANAFGSWQWWTLCSRHCSIFFLLLKIYNHQCDFIGDRSYRAHPLYMKLDIIEKVKSFSSLLHFVKLVALTLWILEIIKISFKAMWRVPKAFCVFSLPWNIFCKRNKEQNKGLRRVWSF